MHIQWYPGHMAKARRVITEHMKAIDVVIELRDARIPISSANPIVPEIVGQKPRILALNKADLTNVEYTRAWMKYFCNQGIMAIPLNSRDSQGKKDLLKQIHLMAEPVLQRWLARGIRNRSVRTIILGIPNVGKSTLINSMAKSYVAHTADRPGKTRGQQWVKLGKNMELLDTPGVLWPKFEDKIIALRLAATGAIAEEIYDPEPVVIQLLIQLSNDYQELLSARYGEDILKFDSAEEKLIYIAKKRGCILAGGVADLEKARRLVLNDYQSGRLGKATLDRLEELI